ncbi:MAG TPA: hypothetical protein VMV42_00275, partial [archaeon]|nr:hypothetical protein [archaeon]
SVVSITLCSFQKRLLLVLAVLVGYVGGFSSSGAKRKSRNLSSKLSPSSSVTTINRPSSLSPSHLNGPQTCGRLSRLTIASKRWPFLGRHAAGLL